MENTEDVDKLGSSLFGTATKPDRCCVSSVDVLFIGENCVLRTVAAARPLDNLSRVESTPWRPRVRS